MNLITIFHALVLLTLANGAPVIAKRLLGNHFTHPLDCGLNWFDGRRLFGHAKTVRGILASVFACGVGGLLLGIHVHIAVAVAVAAMLGDLLSSFIKRRLAIEPSGQAFGLDYIPEALVPALVLTHMVGLSLADVTIIVIVFWLGAAALSPLLHHIGLRDRPY